MSDESNNQDEELDERIDMFMIHLETWIRGIKIDSSYSDDYRAEVRRSLGRLLGKRN